MSSPDPIRRLNAALEGRYQIERELGEGGMATVYLADDERHGRAVALKVLKPDFALMLGAERFLREIRITARLNHPHILPLLDSGAVDGLLYYVMPYFEGESLRSRLDRDGQLAVDEALGIAAEVADALSFAHAQGVVHRDIKPGNILLSSGHAVVADFGIARAVTAAGGEKLTETATAIGTPAYMSPEQIGGTLELDARSDIYSLACVLYEMLAGEPPHTGRSAQSIFAKRLAEPVPSVRTVRETVPIPIDLALKKAMAKAPPDRFDTAAGFAEVLEGRTFSVPHVAERRRGPSRTKVAGTVAIAAALAWLVPSLGPSETLAYSEDEWILVTQFQNATGDSVLDKGLDMALSLTLQQSRRIKVFPAARVQTALGRMLLDEQSPITESVGREIALREGVRFVLVPSVAAVGERYALGLSFQDPSSDEPLHTELIRVDGKEEILEGLDELGSRARRVLGESRGMVREQLPLADVTTSSLPALRQFSLGLEARVRFIDLVEARRLVESALAIDGDFIAAHAELGILELEFFGNREEGIRHLTLALANLDRLTDFEGRLISGLYKDLVEQDLAGAVEEYRALADLYPNRSEPRNNLGWLFWRMGRFDEAVAEYKEALRVDEGFHWAYVSLNRLQLFQMGMLDSGLVAARRQLDQDDEFDYAWAHVGWVLTARDSLEAASAAFERAVELNPREGLHWEGLAHSYRLMGRVEDAAAALTSVLELDSLSVNGWYELGQLYQASGDAARGGGYLAGTRRILERRLSAEPDAADALARLSLVLTKLGDEAGAAQAAERALESGGASPLVLFELGCAAMARGDRSAALDYLERAVASGYTNVLWLMRHPDLEPIWSDPAFTSIVTGMIH